LYLGVADMWVGGGGGFERTPVIFLVQALAQNFRAIALNNVFFFDYQSQSVYFLGR